MRFLHYKFATGICIVVGSLAKNSVIIFLPPFLATKGAYLHYSLFPLIRRLLALVLWVQLPKMQTNGERNHHVNSSVPLARRHNTTAHDTLVSKVS